MSNTWLGQDVVLLLMDEHPDSALQERWWREFFNVLRVISLHQTGDRGNAGEYEGLVWVWARERPAQVARAFNMAGWAGVHLRLRNAERQLKQVPEVTSCGAVAAVAVTT